MPHSIRVAAKVVDPVDGSIPERADGLSAIYGRGGPAGPFGRAEGRPSYHRAPGGYVSIPVGG